MPSTHYAKCTMDPKLMLKFSDWAANVIKETTKGDPVLVYSGMSGTAIATAIALELALMDIEPLMVYCRKHNEISHGQRVEHNWNEWLNRDNKEEFNVIGRQFYFVDDFVESGTTLRYCKDAVEEWFSLTLDPDNLSIITYTEGGDCDDPESDFVLARFATYQYAKI